MNAVRSRPGRLRATACALVVALGFAALSFWDTDPEVYLFPRLITSGMLILAAIMLADLLRPAGGADEDAAPIPWRRLAAGLVIAVVMVALIEVAGFYLATGLAFFAVVLVYGGGAGGVKALAWKAGVTLAFMTTIYLLFWKLLYVRTPTGWLL